MINKTVTRWEKLKLGYTFACASISLGWCVQMAGIYRIITGIPDQHRFFILIIYLHKKISLSWAIDQFENSLPNSFTFCHTDRAISSFFTDHWLTTCVNLSGYIWFAWNISRSNLMDDFLAVILNYFGPSLIYLSQFKSNLSQI